jgi:hypothetical protein
MLKTMFNLRLVSKKGNSVYEENVILEKTRKLINQSKTYEQLNTTKKFMDLFLKGIKSPYIIEDIKNKWSEKNEALKLG